METFESDEGMVRVHLYNTNTKENFPTESHNAYLLKTAKIKNNKSKVVFENLPYGEYALTVHHDKNNNIKMDKNFFGLPAEGWGLSKNVKPFIALPDFEDCSFTVNKKSTIINIIIRN